MTDNLNVPGGSAGPVATDEIASTHYQRIKLIHGADGVNAGDVSTANPYPVYLANVERAEDAAHSSGHSGVPVLAVRNDTAAALAGTTGDYIPLTTDSTGRAWVNAENLTAPVGAVGETAPASDTASSGLNGRLQRIAQRITSLIALLPASLGQTTKAGSLSVTIASDQTIAAGSAYKWVNCPAIGMTAITYDGEDVVGGLNTISSVTNTKAFNLVNVTLRARDVDIVKDYMLIFFDSEPTASTFSNGGTVTINTANKDNVTLMLPINDTDFVTIGAGGTYFATASKTVGQVLGCTGTLYMVIVAKESIIAVANSLELSIGVLQDA
jgi:hypothetical protein